MEGPSTCAATTGLSFIASCMQDWLKAQAIKTLYIKAGKTLGKTGILRAFMTNFAMNV